MGSVIKPPRNNYHGLLPEVRALCHPLESYFKKPAAVAALTGLRLSVG